MPHIHISRSCQAILLLAAIALSRPAVAQNVLFSTGTPVVSLQAANVLAVTLPLVNNGRTTANNVLINNITLGGAKVSKLLSPVLPTAPSNLIGGASTNLAVGLSAGGLSAGTNYLLTIRGTYSTDKTYGFTVNRWVKMPNAATTGVVVQPNVIVLPSDGSLSITNVTSTSITLTGNVPRLIPGDVIVSSQGNGLARKVVSFAQAGKGTVVQTSNAALDDLFQQAQIALTKTLAPSDYSSITSTAPGITITTGTSSQSASPSSSAPLASSPTEIINFDKVEIHSPSASGAVSLTGSATIKLGLVLDADVDIQGVNSVKFVPTITGTANITASGQANVTLPSVKIEIAHFVGSPIDFQVGLIPVVVVPIMTLSSTADGKIEVGVDVKSSGSVSIGAGVQYQRGPGWSGVTTFDHQLGIVPTITAKASATCAVTPVNGDVSLMIYGVAGPFVNSDCPKFTFDLEIQSVPRPRGTFSVYGDFDGMVGFRVDILGFKQDYSIPFDVHYLLYRKNLFGYDVYLAGTGNGNQVTVVDAASNSIVTTIDLLGQDNDYQYDCLSVALSPNKMKAYALSVPHASEGEVYNNADFVSVIDTTNDTVTANIPVMNAFGTPVVSPDGSKVYVSTYPLYGSYDSRVAVIDTAANNLTSYIDINSPLGGDDEDLAISGNGKNLYGLFVLAPEILGDVPQALDLKTFAISDLFSSSDLQPLSNFPTTILLPVVKGFSVSPDGTKAYVAEQEYTYQDFSDHGPYDDLILVIDLTTDSLISTTDIGYSTFDYIDDSSEYRVLATPDGTKAYMLNDLDMFVIDGATNTVTRLIGDGDGDLDGVIPNTEAFAISSDSKRLYTRGSIFDTTTDAVIGYLPDSGYGVASE